ncbi:glycine betaine ABC transporter substrate-binding protein [Bacillus sp. B15-48]|uniref:glycine betaine ABC transporter substrate-binding protein n=1 Tax=Bacillus sp. B15-48 TaxID=1548601 RepID=UPI00193FDC67|nr:glycine betaine ABC transporter substrate-binding protein [Bacillus sp. B15-48]MBM4764512.1 glycine/betaine ABC transporter [Bacillus sp. B15-48]
MFKKRVVLSIVLLLALLLAACGNSEQSSGDANEEGTDTDTNSTESIGEQVDYKIIGIEPGAGIMQATQTALVEYENLADWNLVESSSAAMASELRKAYDREEPIIVTGWTPHWKFAKYDLKYLEDSKGIYGEEETIETFVRPGLKDDQPSAYTVLDQFFWTPDDMATVMVEIQEGTDPAEAAAKWVEENSDKVAEWVEGAEEVDGDEISLAYVAWDSEIASTNVVGIALESIGYDVKLVQLEAGPMFASVARGNADATVAAWLPLTHADYEAEYGEDMENLGVNLEGAKTGLVVPSYMDIDSIDDLK